MAVTHVRSGENTADAAASSIAETWGGNPTTGNTVLVWVNAYGPSTDVSGSWTVDDSQSNDYVKIESAVDVDQTNCVALFKCEGITGGTTPTVTVTFDGSYEYRRIIIAEYTGDETPTVNVSDILNGAGAGTVYVCPNVETTEDGCRVVAFAADIEDTVNFAASASPSGQTVRVENTAGGGRMAMLDLSQTSAGSITPSFDGDNSGYDYFSATVALTDVPAVDLDTVLPDGDIVTTGWTTAPLWSKVNDSSDASYITATAS